MNEKDTIWFIEKWFDSHTVMSKDNYDMLKEMLEYKSKNNGDEQQ